MVAPNFPTSCSPNPGPGLPNSKPFMWSPYCTPNLSRRQFSQQRSQLRWRMQGGRASDDSDLPKTLVRKIVKGKLLQVDAAANGGSEEVHRDVQLNKDALLAFSESTKV